MQRIHHFVHKWVVRVLPLVCVSLLGTTDTWAQDAATEKDIEKKTHFLIEPYFMAPVMKGEIGVRQLPATEVDANAEDIFGQLKFGAMAYIEVNYDNKWAVGTDFLYMHLQSDVNPSEFINSGTADARQLVFELSGLYRIAPWFEVGAGGRVMDMSLKLDLDTDNGPQEGTRRRAWIDPIVIVRSQGTVFEKLLLQFRGDFGGFGIGGDYTWQVQANIGYKFSNLVHGTFGYRMLDVKHDRGEGSEYFKYDMITSGPVLRLGFRFQ